VENVLQVQNLKVLFQLTCVEQIGGQLRIIATTISLDLLDDELGVFFHNELLNPQRHGCTQPKEQGFVLRHVVDYIEI
jgi:hypothetical protein